MSKTKAKSQSSARTKKSQATPNPGKTGKKRDDVGPGRPPKEHQFKPGNPGRPKGSRNKLGEAFLADMLADWEENGPQAIQMVRMTKPDAYLKVVASILPKELNVNVNELEELTDEELDRRLKSLARELARYEAADSVPGAGAEEAAGPDAVKPVSTLQ